jgi:hypothetical protein
MSSYLAPKHKRSRTPHVPDEANWGQAYVLYRRTGMDHADAAYRADERQKRIDRKSSEHT